MGLFAVVALLKWQGTLNLQVPDSGVGSDQSIPDESELGNEPALPGEARPLRSAGHTTQEHPGQPDLALLAGATLQIPQTGKTVQRGKERVPDCEASDAEFYKSLTLGPRAELAAWSASIGEGELVESRGGGYEMFYPPYQDYTPAALQSLADTGDMRAAYAIGQSIENTTPSEAERWYRFAAVRGHHLALRGLARVRVNSDPTAAAAYWGLANWRIADRWPLPADLAKLPPARIADIDRLRADLDAERLRLGLQPLSNSPPDVVRKQREAQTECDGR
jgi:hypothetical protein